LGSRTQRPPTPHPLSYSRVLISRKTKKKEKEKKTKKKTKMMLGKHMVGNGRAAK
jgi:hypothetical protein